MTTRSVRFSIQLAVTAAVFLAVGCGPGTAPPTQPNSFPPPAGSTTPTVEAGLDVGTPAPDFKLKDQAGRDRSLADLRRGGPVAVVFYRSAGW